MGLSVPGRLHRDLLGYSRTQSSILSSPWLLQGLLLDVLEIIIHLRPETQSLLLSVVFLLSYVNAKSNIVYIMTSLEIQYFHSTTWHQVSLLYFQYHATSFLPHMMLLWACTTLFFAKGYQGISTQNSEVSVWEASSSWVLYLAKFSHFICPGILIFTSWAQRVHHSLLGLEPILPVQNRT